MYCQTSCIAVLTIAKTKTRTYIYKHQTVSWANNWSELYRTLTVPGWHAAADYAYCCSCHLLLRWTAVACAAHAVAEREHQTAMLQNPPLPSALQPWGHLHGQYQSVAPTNLDHIFRLFGCLAQMYRSEQCWTYLGHRGVDAGLMLPQLPETLVAVPGIVLDFVLRSAFARHHS